MSSHISPPLFTWSQQRVGSSVIVRVAGEFDMTTWCDVEHQLQEVIRCDGASSILLDLSGLAFIDAHCAGLIMHAEADARVYGRTLHVDGLSELPSRVFSLLGLDYLRALPARGKGTEEHAVAGPAPGPDRGPDQYG